MKLCAGDTWRTEVAVAFPTLATGDGRRWAFDVESARLGAMLGLGTLVRDVREQMGLTQTGLVVA